MDGFGPNLLALGRCLAGLGDGTGSPSTSRNTPLLDRLKGRPGRPSPRSPVVSRNVLLFVIATNLCLYGVTPHVTWVWLELFGTATPATVVAKAEALSNIEGTYVVTYQFVTANGERAHQGEQSVDEHTYHRLPVESPVLVKYLPTAPHISHLTGPDMDYTPLWAPSLLVILPGILWLPVAVEVLPQVATINVQEAVTKFIRRRTHPK